MGNPTPDGLAPPTVDRRGSLRPSSGALILARPPGRQISYFEWTTPRPRAALVEDQDYLDAIKVKREMFDLGFANELYTALIGPVEMLVKDKRRLLVVPFGPLTALPFHLLVTEKPPVGTSTIDSTVTAEDMAPYRDAAWLTKRQAVSVMPSVASLKALRLFGRKEAGAKPMIGFGDPIFNAVAAATAEQHGVRKPAARSLATRSYTTSGKALASTAVNWDSPCRSCPTPPTNSRLWRGISARLSPISILAATPAKLLSSGRLSPITASSTSPPTASWPATSRAWPSLRLRSPSRRSRPISTMAS
jgi:hypothetical protein